MRVYFILSIAFLGVIGHAQSSPDYKRDVQEIYQESQVLLQQLKDSKKPSAVSELIEDNKSPSRPGREEKSAQAEAMISSSRYCKSSVVSGNKGSDQANSKNEILIFVSLDMPSESLKKYFIDSQAVGGRLVIRGLCQDSFAATHQRLHELEINVDIDPNLFEEYQITQVPVILHKTGDKKDRVMGHISLDAALDLFAMQGETSSTAAHRLKQLRGEKCGF